MAYVHYDRISETTTTSGTADLVVSGALPGARPFSTLTNGEQFVYCLEEGTSYEIADGTWNSSTSEITRGTLHSSTTGAKLNLSGSGATVMLIVSSKWIQELEATIADHAADIASNATDIAAIDTLQYWSESGSGHLWPDVTNTRDIGTASRRPRNLYLSGNATVGGSATFTGAVSVQGLDVITSFLSLGNDISDLEDIFAAGIADGTHVTAGGDQITTQDGLITAFTAGSGGGVPQHVGHRLSLSASDPYPSADQTAKTVLYLLPFVDNLARLYDGSAWQLRTIASLSFDISTDTDYDGAAIASGSLYDVFLDWNGGTHQLVLKKWSTSGAGSSTRATALVKQDGVDVLSGATDHVFLGTIYVDSSTELEDSDANRYVGNQYNPRMRYLEKNVGTIVHNYNGGVRPWNNNTSYRMNFVSPEVRPFEVTGIIGTIDNSPAKAGAALDSTSTALVVVENRSGAFHRSNFQKKYKVDPGFHYVQWIEDSENSGFGTFYEIAGSVTIDL